MNIASQKITSIPKTGGTRLILAWLLGNVGAYFLTSFFRNFYPGPFQFVLLSLFFQLTCGISVYFLLGEITHTLQTENHYDWLAILTLFVPSVLSVSAVVISWQFPGLFARRILFMNSTLLLFFIFLSVVSLGSLVLLFKRMDRSGFTERMKQTRFFKFIQENLPGILLALFFLFTYFVFAESINFPGFRTLDQYFDTDISEWIQRFTTATRQDVDMVRAVHPAVLVFLRPMVWFLSLFLHGDRLHAVFLLNALTGALCVFFAWLIMKRASGNTAYSLIIALLLGASTSHLLLSSMLETYIYSALALLVFIFLIQNENTSLKFTIPAGILVFGITITNIVQTCILYFFKYPRFKAILKYVLTVVLITSALNLFQVWLYPNASSLFKPANLLGEQKYVANPVGAAWRTEGRISLTARAILLYGIVAPTPFILTKELGVDVPNFRTFQILLGEFHVAGYRGLADITVKFWIAILALAGILFILNLRSSPKQALFPLSLLLCMGFSFALHIVYGDDPMLYSPDWTYALILFVGFAFQRWANQKWLQVLMIIFLVMLMTTNLRLIHQIMQVSAPFYGKGF